MSRPPGSSARRIAILLGFGVLLLALFVWWRSASDTRAPALGAGTAGTATAVAADAPPSPSDPAAPAAVPASDARPLPAADVPFDRIVDDLQRRADAGDRAAACRLGFELMRCRHLQASAAAVGAMAEHESALESQGVDGFEGADAAAQDQIRMVQRATACRAVDPALQARGGDYLELAARAGHVEAMLRYAKGEGLPPRPRNRPPEFGILRDPAFQRWRRDAPGMLQRAFAAGHVPAAILYNYALQDGSGQWPEIYLFSLESLVPDDPVALGAHRLLNARLENLGPALDDHVLQGLDAAQQVKARADAERWHRELFGGRQLGPNDARSISEVSAPWSADAPGVVPCEETP